MKLYKHQQDIIDADPNEKWMSVIGYEGLYEVSNFGRVRGKRGVFKISKFKSGYIRVCLTKNNIEKTNRVHRLVAHAFIPNKGNKPFINHIDNNIENNHFHNLEWCTSKENKAHCLKQGRHAHGSLDGNSKLTEKQVIQIRKSSLTAKDLSCKYGVTATNIYDVRNRKTWKHI